MTDHSDPVSRGDVDHRFGPSGVPPMNDEQIRRIGSIREHARLFARHVLADAPPSWERDEAIRSIDDACSYAARAVSRHE